MFLELQFASLTLDGPVDLTYAPDSSNLLFAVLQSGQIVVFPDESTADVEHGVFLDISKKVAFDSKEQGLLGMAFDPRYAKNGYFYVNYTAPSPRRTVISRFSVDREDPYKADPASELVILEVEQPYANHNGGCIKFGPDYYLYIGLGDGGGAGDPKNNGQNLNSLLGKILRIDVDNSTPETPYTIPPDNPFVNNENGYKEEIWAYGFRNPWRFSFDSVTGELWVGDVGQDKWEEIDIVNSGANYGWNIMEGGHCYSTSSGKCNDADLAAPLWEYSHDDGCSVIGGYVYRGQRLGTLFGLYLYADYCSGNVWALRYDGEQVIENLELSHADLNITSFGEGQSGEIYILTEQGRIYRLNLAE